MSLRNNAEKLASWEINYWIGWERRKNVIYMKKRWNDETCKCGYMCLRDFRMMRNMWIVCNCT